MHMYVYAHIILFPWCCINARYPTQRGENNGDSIATRPLVAFTARARVSCVDSEIYGDIEIYRRNEETYTPF